MTSIVNSTSKKKEKKKEMPDDEIETTGRPRRHTMRNTLSLSLSFSFSRSYIPRSLPCAYQNTFRAD